MAFILPGLSYLLHEILFFYTTANMWSSFFTQLLRNEVDSNLILPRMFLKTIQLENSIPKNTFNTMYHVKEIYTEAKYL